MKGMGKKMNESSDRRWAIISHITFFGWIAAVIATLKKEKSRFLCCYLNNGLILFLYGCLLGPITWFYEHGIYSIGGGAAELTLSYIIQHIFDAVMFVLNAIYFILLIAGLVYAIKGEERRIPYFFRIKFLDNINYFKATVGTDMDVEESAQNENPLNIQNALSGAIHNVKKAAVVAGVQSEVQKRVTKKCPSCGKEVALNNTFCIYCGNKFEVIVPNEMNKQKREVKRNDRLKVVDYLKTIKEFKCERCGEIVTGNDRFCPSCGSPVVIKIKPKSCLKCGKKFTEEFDFCPGCGTPIELIELQTNCKKCGADLIYGKDFCVNCGTKVNG